MAKLGYQYYNSILPRSYVKFEFCVDGSRTMLPQWSEFSARMIHDDACDVIKETAMLHLAYIQIMKLPVELPRYLCSCYSLKGNINVD